MVLQLPRDESFMGEAVSSSRRPPNLGQNVQDKSLLVIAIVIVIGLVINRVMVAVGITILNQAQLVLSFSPVPFSNYKTAEDRKKQNHMAFPENQGKACKIS